jgi:hypothetical protein
VLTRLGFLDDSVDKLSTKPSLGFVPQKAAVSHFLHDCKSLPRAREWRNALASGFQPLTKIKGSPYDGRKTAILTVSGKLGVNFGLQSARRMQ